MWPFSYEGCLFPTLHFAYFCLLSKDREREQSRKKTGKENSRKRKKEQPQKEIPGIPGVWGSQVGNRERTEISCDARLRSAARPARQAANIRGSKARGDFISSMTPVCLSTRRPPTRGPVPSTFLRCPCSGSYRRTRLPTSARPLTVPREDRGPFQASSEGARQFPPP